MKSRITLSIDKRTLTKAKKLSLSKKKSISRLFEEYIKENETKKKKITSSETPITDSLKGILKGLTPDKTYKELRDMMMEEKYGL